MYNNLTVILLQFAKKNNVYAEEKHFTKICYKFLKSGVIVMDMRPFAGIVRVAI